jgi:curved DNA-binding protein CbpA
MATPSPSDPSPPEANHYELLRVSESATPQQLRSAFRSLSKLYHPDTTSLPQAQAAQSFQRLQQAYAVLSDPVARRAYDLRRMLPGQPKAPVSGIGVGQRPLPQMPPAAIRSQDCPAGKGIAPPAHQSAPPR